LGAYTAINPVAIESLLAAIPDLWAKTIMHSKTNININHLLNEIFNKSSKFLKLLAPFGWANSAYVNFLYPTAKQQYEEVKILNERLNKLTQQSIESGNDSLDKYQQNDLNTILEEEEFRYVLGLSVYDIFSDNHEVYSVSDNSVYDFGSFRNSGRLIADFFNDKYSGKKYDYIDFYMGTIWIKDRGDLLPFYEFIFKVLKTEECDWNYVFPRLFLLDLNNSESSKDNSETYKPEEAMLHELDRKNKEKEFDDLQNELDSTFQEEYENAKYKPLVAIVQAYKTIYGKLPNGHPQKAFE